MQVPLTINALPLEVLQLIVSMLHWQSRFRLRLVNNTWEECVCKSFTSAPELVGWLSTILSWSGSVHPIKSLSFERLYRCAYTMCMKRKRKELTTIIQHVLVVHTKHLREAKSAEVVSQAIDDNNNNSKKRKRGDDNAQANAVIPTLQRRIVMMQDVLMFREATLRQDEQPFFNIAAAILGLPINSLPVSSCLQMARERVIANRS